LSRTALHLLAVLLIAGAAHADGGAIRLQGTAGPFAVTVFSPEPLRAGLADLSVLVQSEAGGETILDATVDFTLEPPAGGVVRARATREAATNKLLLAAEVDLIEPGAWKLHVDVQRGAETGQLDGVLAVEPSPPRLWSLWPYLALPPIIVALFAIGQWLSHRRH
jgi:hypothetical protein